MSLQAGVELWAVANLAGLRATISSSSEICTRTSTSRIPRRRPRNGTDCRPLFRMGCPHRRAGDPPGAGGATEETISSPLAGRPSAATGRDLHHRAGHTPQTTPCAYDAAGNRTHVGVRRSSGVLSLKPCRTLVTTAARSNPCRASQTAAEPSTALFARPIRTSPSAGVLAAAAVHQAVATTGTDNRHGTARWASSPSPCSAQPRGAQAAETDSRVS